MAKCATCGEVNAENSSFCVKCGSALAKQEFANNDATMEKARKNFERDALLSLDRSKITFVCELCGTINTIDSAKCVRCGKPRPRSEFVNALRKIKSSGIAQEEVSTQIEEVQEEPVVTPDAPVEEIKEEAKQLSLYKYEPNPEYVKQNHSMVQPFVIVPYVDTMQKVWQYNPQQVYKFQPYTDAEKTALQSSQALGADDLLAIKQQELARLNSLQHKEQRPAHTSKGKKVRINAIFSLVLSVAIIAVLFLLPVVGIANYQGIEIFKSLGNCINGLFNMNIDFSSSLYQYNNWTSVLIPVFLTLIMLFSAIVAIISIFKLISGKAKLKGVVLSVIIMLISLGTLLAAILTSDKSFLDALIDIHYGLYCVLGISVAMIISSALGAKLVRR